MMIRARKLALCALFASTILFSIPLLPATAACNPNANITRVSVSSSGGQANDHSTTPDISGDGHYIVFRSDATNLVPGQAPFFARSLFVHDRLTCKTTLISVYANGTQSDGNAQNPSISSDGRYIAFDSSDDFTSQTTTFYNDVFVIDRLTRQSKLASVSSSGTIANGSSTMPQISGDGRYVVYHSGASNLVSGDNNQRFDIFVHDLQTGETTRVSINTAGVQGNGDSYNPVISNDGNKIAFHSSASNLQVGDTNNTDDVFVRDRQAGQTVQASAASNGDLANTWSAYPAISDNGRFVAFRSYASNLVPDDTNNTYDVFVRDLETNQTQRVTVAYDGTQEAINSGIDPNALSADGRFVVFEAYSRLTADDTNNFSDIFVRDLKTGQIALVSKAYNGASANHHSFRAAISADGQYITFLSNAWNLVPGDTNQYDDIFVTPNPLAPRPSPPNAAPTRDRFESLPITLTWNSISWAVEYQIEVDQSQSFPNPASFYTAMTPDLSATITTLPQGRYYWRVRAKDPGDVWGSWSAVQSFTYHVPD
jgi:Tol biopolymer transport system component